MKEKIVSTLKDIKGIRRFLIWFYLIGVAGLLIPASSGFFILLTPLALLMNFGLLMLHHRTGFKTKTVLAFFFIFIAGFIVEVIGVQTGIVFGNYTYGNGLGLKIWDTPVLIGMNWLLLIYTTGTIVQNIKIPPFLRIAAGASMMLVYDLVLEQVAPKMNMWSWQNDRVPIENYITWWLVAATFHALIEFFGIKLRNPLSVVVLTVQFLFFVVLFLFM